MISENFLFRVKKNYSDTDAAAAGAAAAAAAAVFFIPGVAAWQQHLCLNNFFDPE